MTKVTWAIRRPGVALRAIHEDPLPARRHLVEASLRLASDPPHWLTFLGSVAVESVAFDHGTFTTELTRLEAPGRDPHPTVRSDRVVALVGYGPDATIYDQLQVHTREAASHRPMELATGLSWEAGPGAGVTADGLRQPEPNFYILGAKSYGTNSNFLMRTGHEQVRAVFGMIVGASGSTDLYAGMAKG